MTSLCYRTVVMQSPASSKALSGLCRVRQFIVRQPDAAGCQCRFRSDDLQLRPNIQSPERTKAVTSFYFQSAIDQAAAKASVRLMPSTMLYSGRSADQIHLIRSAQYLHKELPVRIAHRITGFRYLPFIVGCHPSILACHELYIRAFHRLSEIEPVTDAESELKFRQALTSLLEQHREVVTMLAEGFTDCRRHIQDVSVTKSFLDSMLTSRLGMRLLCEHHLKLHEDKPNHVGVITVNFSPKTLIERKAESTRKMCIEKYGAAPEVKVTGHTATVFPYIMSPLDYILHEILKNSMRATVEAHKNLPSEKLPPVTVTVASNDVDFIIKISDRGGGIRHDVTEKIWEYGFTSPGYQGGLKPAHSDSSSRIPDGLFDELMNNRSTGKMHGYGFGLPVCRAYAQYLGGDLTMETMQGIGSDFFIRLRHINGQVESFRI